MQQQQVISIPGHEVTNPIPTKLNTNCTIPAIIAIIQPIMLQGNKQQIVKIQQTIPKQNVA